MYNYELIEISPQDTLYTEQMDKLLAKEGIERDRNLEYSLGIVDQNSELIATGSCFRDTLRCLAVDSACQGEGLMNEIVTQLMYYEFNRGITNIFLYTKCSNENIFLSMGFHRIALVKETLVFMETKRNGFQDYLAGLLSESTISGGIHSAVVLNANPFTLGHFTLLQTASQASDAVHVFVVSEDCSEIPFPSAIN